MQLQYVCRTYINKSKNILTSVKSTSQNIQSKQNVVLDKTLWLLTTWNKNPYVNITKTLFLPYMNSYKAFSSIRSITVRYEKVFLDKWNFLSPNH